MSKHPSVDKGRSISASRITALLAYPMSPAFLPLVMAEPAPAGMLAL
jgi:hypothetical protein